MAQLIAVFGASPGIGKTTLTRRLAADAPPGARVERFDEEDILSRPEFATVAAQLSATGEVDLDALLDASARFVTSAQNYDLVVTDTLFPFVPSLLAWGHDEATIRSFLAQLDAILRPLHPIVVYLDGEPADALPRAASRGDTWLRACSREVLDVQDRATHTGPRGHGRTLAPRTRRDAPSNDRHGLHRGCPARRSRTLARRPRSGGPAAPRRADLDPCEGTRNITPERPIWRA